MFLFDFSVQIELIRCQTRMATILVSFYCFCKVIWFPWLGNKFGVEWKLIEIPVVWNYSVTCVFASETAHSQVTIGSRGRCRVAAVKGPRQPVCKYSTINTHSIQQAAYWEHHCWKEDHLYIQGLVHEDCMVFAPVITCLLSNIGLLSQM